MTQYEKSAIIGYWRCCQNIEQIMALTGYGYNLIDFTIKYYLKYNG